MHKYSLHNYAFKNGLFSGKKSRQNKPYFVEYNFTEDDKINDVKNNER